MHGSPVVGRPTRHPISFGGGSRRRVAERFVSSGPAASAARVGEPAATRTVPQGALPGRAGSSEPGAERTESGTPRSTGPASGASRPSGRRGDGRTELGPRESEWFSEGVDRAARGREELSVVPQTGTDVAPSVPERSRYGYPAARDRTGLRCRGPCPGVRREKPCWYCFRGSGEPVPYLWNIPRANVT